MDTYSAEGYKGIDIAGNGVGKVVYSGDGLVGYGKLLVTEGSKVDKDQSIAGVGSVGSQACLHFEIRKNGSPVNPVEYLPEM